MVGDDQAGDEECMPLDGLGDQDDVNGHFSDDEGKDDDTEGQDEDPNTNVEGTEREPEDEGGAGIGLSIFGGGEDNGIEVIDDEVKPFMLKESKVKKEKTTKSEVKRGSGVVMETFWEVLLLKHKVWWVLGMVSQDPNTLCKILQQGFSG
ncbi:hypothetical protein L208DRAFT_1379185 [Tricholoma matsutake]|nr:hypothetical protein L208DRAFT_1379185 [Tricholoma matsutake 945]